MKIPITYPSYQKAAHCHRSPASLRELPGSVDSQRLPSFACLSSRTEVVTYKDKEQ
jgi:hypothetical protein